MTRTDQSSRCAIAEDRAEFAMLARELAAYGERDSEPPRELAEEHRAYIRHFVALSQGR